MHQYLVCAVHMDVPEGVNQYYEVPLNPQLGRNLSVQVLNKDTVRMRVWERGAGITRACGTGACATAVAAFVNGLAPRTSDIVMDGGTLDIEWRESDNHVYMTGPAAFVYDGEIDQL